MIIFKAYVDGELLDVERIDNIVEYTVTYYLWGVELYIDTGQRLIEVLVGTENVKKVLKLLDKAKTKEFAEDVVIRAYFNSRSIIRCIKPFGKLFDSWNVIEFEGDV